MSVSLRQFQRCYNPGEMRSSSRSAREPLDSTLSRARFPFALVLALLLATLAGCGGGSADTDDGWYTLILVPAQGTDPFADPTAEYLYLRIETASLDALAAEEFPIDSDDLTMDHAPTGSGLYFVVEVRNGAEPRGVLAVGRSGPHTLEKGEHTTVTVVLEEP